MKRYPNSGWLLGTIRTALPLLCAALAAVTAWPDGGATTTVYTTSTPAPAQTTGIAIVEAWFNAMNALNDSDESVERLVSIYAERAQHITGPESHQKGTVTFDGSEALRHMARGLAERYEGLSVRIETVTANEQSTRLFHLADGPWEGVSVAVQFSYARTVRKNGKRYTFPAAGFFWIQDGRILRARIYHAAGEAAEVEPLR